MNNLNYGLKFSLISSILFSGTMIAAAIYAHTYFNDGVAWITRYGRFGSALYEIGLVPTVVSLTFAIVGLVYIVIHYKKYYRKPSD
ncbi:phosphatase [Halalkalibacter alkalisediminis]|uniref:Uncharacterized protein n=1 Tax=Halalkalibacter alkalisediminis TaxID=935616 RepID=A0ABV6NKX1_9BACI|nr:phosphatase [Halalkalibacter alkalisediminis]